VSAHAWCSPLGLWPGISPSRDLLSLVGRYMSELPTSPSQQSGMREMQKCDPHAELPLNGTLLKRFPRRRAL
jgi:hypothetical protein